MSVSKFGPMEALLSNAAVRDSDSGHERTSSSASNSSGELGGCLDGVTSEQTTNGDGECFVDAQDNFQLEAVAAAAAKGLDGAPEAAGGQESGRDGIGEQQEEEERTQVELKERLKETTVILRMALNNEFAKALDICSRRAHQELYASLAHATLSFLRAALTLEQADLQAALAAINQSFEVSGRKRRKTSVVMRFLYRPNYNTYTDDQIHAELVHAESLLLLALISFLADQSIICLVKGAFRIRACYQRYKECLYMMENRHEWQSDEARCHFESGVRMGHGIFNLLMSYLPRRVLRFLEYVGFSGNRSVGVDELDRSVALSDGLRSVFSALVILTYHSYIENLFGLGSYDAEKVEQLNDSLLGHYPNSAFFLLFRGRYHQMRGDLDAAIDSFQRCIEAQDDWKQFHAICHWEMMWCYAVQMDWPQAAHYSDLLRKESKWSAASYTYQYGTFLYAQLVEDERRGLCAANSDDYAHRIAEIRRIMERVPELRIRYAGKTIPAEKFAITRAAKFCQQKPNRLSLPALEFLYIWNIFATLRNSPQQVERLLERIDGEIDHINRMKLGETTTSLNGQEEDEAQSESGAGSSSGVSEVGGDPEDNDQDDQDDEQATVDPIHWDDDLSLMFLLKGMCLKHLKKLSEAEETFLKVIDNEANIVADTFLVPHTAMELSQLKLTLQDHDSAKKWVRLARNNYTGYLLETIVHFRLHAVSRMIRIEQQQDSYLNNSTKSESTSLVDVQQLTTKVPNNNIEASIVS